MYFWLLVALPLISFAQMGFVPGHIIGNNGERIEGYIKNLDWKNNPTEFSFRTTETAAAELIKIDDASEFEVGGNHFERANVDIDLSVDNLARLSQTRNPENKNLNLFLKRISDGNIKLYEYRAGNLVRFFYKTDDQFQQLIYKPYESSPNILSYNTEYKNQLPNLLQCEKVTDSKIEATKYTQRDLLELFNTYHSCADPNFQKVSAPRHRHFRISVTPRVNFSNFSVEQYGANKAEIGPKTSVSAGLEFEYIFPFHHRKWSLFLEHAYFYHKGSQANPYPFVNEGQLISTIDYQSIMLHGGIRHYFHLGSSSKIFANVAAVPHFRLKRSMIQERMDGTLFKEIKLLSNFTYSLGAGYKFADKYSVEARYYLPSRLTGKYSMPGEHTNFSIILGYTLF